VKNLFLIKRYDCLTIKQYDCLHVCSKRIDIRTKLYETCIHYRCEFGRTLTITPCTIY